MKHSLCLPRNTTEGWKGMWLYLMDCLYFILSFHFLFIELQMLCSPGNMLHQVSVRNSGNVHEFPGVLDNGNT